MTHYAVSQIVKLIQDNLHDERYHDVSKYRIDSRVRMLMKDVGAKRYPPVTENAKFSLDENFKNLALATLTDFKRTIKPTDAEIQAERRRSFINDMGVTETEHEGTWFKLANFYFALEYRNALPDGMNPQSFWQRAHHKLKDFKNIYVLTTYHKPKHREMAIKHYALDDLDAIISRLVQEDILNEDRLPKYLKTESKPNGKPYNENLQSTHESNSCL